MVMRKQCSEGVVGRAALCQGLDGPLMLEETCVLTRCCCDGGGGS